MERILKFSLTSFLIFLIAFSTVKAKELEGIFIKFDKVNSTISVLTKKGLVSLKIYSFSQRATKVLKNLREGYKVKIEFNDGFIKKIDLKEKPQ